MHPPHSLPWSLLAGALACSSDISDAPDMPEDPSQDCQFIQAPTECPNPPPTYADVAPIIEEHCLGCHDGTQDNWPLTSYGHVADWASDIRAELRYCTMPPDDAATHMSLEEREAILRWILCGYPK